MRSTLTSASQNASGSDKDRRQCPCGCRISQKGFDTTHLARLPLLRLFRGIFLRAEFKFPDPTKNSPIFFLPYVLKKLHWRPMHTYFTDFCPALSLDAADAAFDQTPANEGDARVEWTRTWHYSTATQRETLTKQRRFHFWPGAFLQKSASHKTAWGRLHRSRPDKKRTRRRTNQQAPSILSYQSVGSGFRLVEFGRRECLGGGRGRPMWDERGRKPNFLNNKKEGLLLIQTRRDGDVGSFCTSSTSVWMSITCELTQELGIGPLDSSFFVAVVALPHT